MAKAHETWTVLKHDPIEKLAENLWRVKGALPGMSLKRNMVVARLSSGGLVIHNGIALDEASMRELEAWGTLFGSAPGPRVSRLAKLLFIKDRSGLRAEFERLAALPDLVRLVVAHEKVAHGPDASAALRMAATFL
ncbi:MAG TPA: hypothetical protein VEY30_06880 [Myxococcaceae bacterium]|nr:hypothetical protein [Myxococcaceae bacterium]